MSHILRGLFGDKKGYVTEGFLGEEIAFDIAVALLIFLEVPSVF
jgi:hypothetical protein